MRPAAVREQIGDQAHRGLRRVDVGAAGRVLLQEVVLHGPVQRGGVDPPFLGDELVEQEQDRRGRVDRHRRRDRVERDRVQQPAHVLDRVDRHAGLAHLALGARVVRVQAHLRRKVERDREPRLPMLEQVPEPRVGLVGRGHPRVLPHRPQSPEVHRRVHAAGERRLAGQTQVPFGVEAPEIDRLVDRLEVDPGVGRPRFDVAHPEPRVAGSIGAVDIVDPRIEDYMRTLLTRYDEPVLLEMEAEGKERGFPIIGRLVGVTVELLARSIGARTRVRARLGVRVLGLLVLAGGGARRRGPRDGRRPGQRAEGARLPFPRRPGGADPLARRRRGGEPRSRRGRVRRRLRRHRQGGVPRRVAGGSRTDPRGRALRLRQRAVVGRCRRP